MNLVSQILGPGQRLASQIRSLQGPDEAGTAVSASPKEPSPVLCVRLVSVYPKESWRGVPVVWEDEE